MHNNIVVHNYIVVTLYILVYNEKYFQKVSFCVITHPIGQNGRTVCKKHGNHGDARGAKCRARRGRPAGHPSRVQVLEYVRVQPWGRPAKQDGIGELTVRCHTGTIVSMLEWS